MRSNHGRAHGAVCAQTPRADAALMADPNYTAQPPAATAAETAGHCASSVTMATAHAHHRPARRRAAL